MINNTNRNNTNNRTGGCGCRNNLVGRSTEGRNNGCGNNNCGNRNCSELLNRLRAVDFALTETVLYLDAYPKCSEAMETYHKLVAERKQLVEAYENQCGPLTMYGNGRNGWEWTQGPWPWEAEAN